MSTCPTHRPEQLVDPYYMRRMCGDPTPWGLAEVGAAIGLPRQKYSKLWNNTLNYLQGGLTEWPPSGDTLGKRLPTAGTALEWWPSHVAVLPAPDLPWTVARPRWTAGCIRKWALEVGRMTWSFDLTPRLPSGRGYRHPKSLAAPSEVDLATVRRLVTADELWEITDIARFFELAEGTVSLWARATLNLWVGGVTLWPPTFNQARHITHGGTRKLDWWPNHHRLLPPPVMVRSGDELHPAEMFRANTPSRRRNGPVYLWRAGDIAMYGLHTGRLRPDGTISPLHA